MSWMYIATLIMWQLHTHCGSVFDSARDCLQRKALSWCTKFRSLVMPERCSPGTDVLFGYEIVGEWKNVGLWRMIMWIMCHLLQIWPNRFSCLPNCIMDSITLRYNRQPTTQVCRCCARQRQANREMVCSSNNSNFKSSRSSLLLCCWFISGVGESSMCARFSACTQQGWHQGLVTQLLCLTLSVSKMCCPGMLLSIL